SAARDPKPKRAMRDTGASKPGGHLYGFPARALITPALRYRTRWPPGDSETAGRAAGAAPAPPLIHRPVPGPRTGERSPTGRCVRARPRVGGTASRTVARAP